MANRPAKGGHNISDPLSTPPQLFERLFSHTGSKVAVLQLSTSTTARQEGTDVKQNEECLFRLDFYIIDTIGIVKFALCYPCSFTNVILMDNKPPDNLSPTNNSNQNVSGLNMTDICCRYDKAKFITLVWCKLRTGIRLCNPSTNA